MLRTCLLLVGLSYTAAFSLAPTPMLAKSNQRVAMSSRLPLKLSGRTTASRWSMEDSSFLKQGGKLPSSLKGAGLSDEARAAAQSLDTEAAWEAAQKRAEDVGGIAVDFNPYDAETGYWLGEWICADCGYIYGSRGENQPFETLGRWYKCPQCAGPRRRFAKKLGGKVGAAAGDNAILISTLIGLAAIIGAFVLALDLNAF